MAAEVIPANVRESPGRRLPVEGIQAWLFVLPALLIIGIFKILPAIAAFYMSLFKWDVVQGAFRGLGNYTDWLYDNSLRSPDFWRSLSTTFTYVIFTVPLEMAIALVIAYLLFQKMRGRGIYRTLYYLPYVTSLVAAAAVFVWVFHPQYGLINDVIGLIGMGPQSWLDEPRGLFELIASSFGVTLPAWLAGPSLALVVLSLVTIWHYMGYQIVIFLAGLSNISSEYYEAARLDGASERQIFTRITLPLLSPTTFFVFTVASIGVLRSFDSVYVLTNGGPLDTTRTVTMLVFKTAFQQAQFGLGAALAFILTLVILLFTLVQFRVLGRRVNYG
ncbi:MAG: sugar ABC transporter permease [Chloroflexi bacterium]|nr:MAG: sugar ABC transporter permease [Chloroflexota bacterium]